MTSSPDKLDLRTAPIAEVCEWVAVEIMGCKVFWTAAGGPGDLCAVAAVERKAREGRLSEWGTQVTTVFGGVKAEWVNESAKCVFSECPIEPEARLRAVALAFEAAGKEGR